MRAFAGFLVAAMVSAFLSNTATAQYVNGFLQGPEYAVRPKPKAAPKIGITEKDFEEIKVGLEKSAEAVAVANAPDYPTLMKLSQLTYDKASIALVKGYIDSCKLKDPQKLYVISKLLQPFVAAKPDVIIEALPMVKEVEKKYHNAYKPYKQLSPLQLKPFQIPDMVKGMATESRLKQLEQIDKRRRARSLEEQPLTIQNECIGELENTFVSMMAFAGDAKEDANLLDWLKDAEAKGNAIWTYALEVIITESANGMTAERANKIYPVLLAWGSSTVSIFNQPYPMRYATKKYVAGFAPQSRLEANSTFWSGELHTGYMILTTCKYVGIAGKQPPMIIPSPAKADKAKYSTDPEFWNPPPKPKPPEGKKPGQK